MGLFSTIARGVGGFLAGGPAGAAAAVIPGLIGGRSSQPQGPISSIPNSIVPGRDAMTRFGSSSCSPPLVRDSNGMCVYPGSPADISVGGRASSSTQISGYGDATKGQFGVALVPAVDSVVVKRCPPGAVLGKDELCYNKSDISKKQRKWNPGRPPLLTGGERNAITRAAAAARKIKNTEKQLQKLGMLKKPTSRGRSSKPQQLRILGGKGDDQIVVAG